MLEALCEGILSHTVRSSVIDINWLGGSIANITRSICLGDPEGERRLVVRCDGEQVHLGLFNTQHTDHDSDVPCPECFDRRCIANLPAKVQWSVQVGNQINCSNRNPLPSLLIDRVALVAKALLEADAGQDVPVVSINLRNGEIRRVSLIADAFCSCANDIMPPSTKPRSIQFDTTLKAPIGRNRMRDIHDYALPMDALVNPLCGALGQSWNYGFAQSITAPVYGSYWQRGHRARPRWVGWSGLCTRGADSKLTGVLEAFERQGGMQPPAAEQIPVRASFAAIGEQAMDPTLCFSYNEASYGLPLSLTRFDVTRECDWIWGYSLTRERPVLVPTALAFYHHLPLGSSAKLIDNNSSGCALGSCFEEAMLKGLFELIERDSFVITWLRKLTLPKIDLDSIDDLKIKFLRERLNYGGVDLSLLDARLDLDLPSIIAVARHRDATVGSIAIGASVALDPIAAIRAALLEAGSAIVELPAMLRYQEDHIRMLAENYNLVTTVTDHQLLYALPEMAATTHWLDGSTETRRFDDAYPAARTLSSGAIGAGLAHCVAMLQAAGLNEVVMVDQTSREQAALGLKTIRAIVPGLAPIDFGHPRTRAESIPRLWSAPAAAGLMASQTLNRMPHPFP